MSISTAQIQEIICRHCNQIVGFLGISGHARAHLGYVPEFEELPIHFIMQRQGAWTLTRRVRRLFIVALLIAFCVNLLIMFLPSRFAVEGNIVDIGWGDTSFPMPAVRSTLDEFHRLPGGWWYQSSTFWLDTGEVCKRYWLQARGPWDKDNVPDYATGLFTGPDGGAYSLMDSVQLIACR